MTEKEIELRSDVYRRLLCEQRESESISDVVERLLQSAHDEHPLEAISGMLDEDEVQRVRERAREFRKDLDDDMDRYS